MDADCPYAQLHRVFSIARCKFFVARPGCILYCVELPAPLRQVAVLHAEVTTLSYRIIAGLFYFRLLFWARRRKRSNRNWPR